MVPCLVMHNLTSKDRMLSGFFGLKEPEVPVILSGYHRLFK